MMRSLSSAVAGLRAHQTKMDVIGNNIANVNTYGFKASRTTFSDVYYQNLGAASSPTGAKGGINPTQIGYGAAVATIDVLNTQSGAASTDRAMDVYITGDGFLAAKDANGNMKYTRLGILGFDAGGNLIDSKGNFIMGFPMDKSVTPAVPKIPSNGQTTSGGLSEIRVDKDTLDRLTNISVGPTGMIVGTMSGDTIGDFSEKVPGISDAALKAGSDYSGPLTLSTTKTFTNPPFGTITNSDGLYAGDYTVTHVPAVPYQPEIPSTGPTDPGTPEVPAEPAKTIFTHKTNTAIVYTCEDFDQTAGSVNSFKDINGNTAFDVVGNDEPVAAMASFAVGLTGVMTYTDKGGTKHTSSATNMLTGTVTFGDVSFKYDPYAQGAAAELKNVSIGKAKPDEGILVNIGNLALGKFANTAGMQEVGDSYFAETGNSGTPTFVVPGLEGTGTLVAGSLEMSNVDISKEFTDMITTQRGFQANTRIITVSDEMLQELVNLKR